jgi:hypothetical protein
MMRSNIFIGEHGTIRINLDRVEFVKAPPAAGSPDPTIVHMMSGKEIILKHGSRDMFERAWRAYCDPDAAEASGMTPPQESGKPKRIVTAIMVDPRTQNGTNLYCACNDGTFWQYSRWNYRGDRGSEVQEQWYLLNPMPQTVIEREGMPEVPQDEVPE